MENLQLKTQFFLHASQVVVTENSAWFMFISEGALIGIKNAVKFSNQSKILKNKPYNLIIKHLDKIPLNKNFNELFKVKDMNKIISFMKSDKKNNSSKINIILIKNFGQIKINYQINQNLLKKFFISELKK